MASKFVASSDIALSKYCVELQALSTHMGLMRVALPVDVPDDVKPVSVHCG